MDLPSRPSGRSDPGIRWGRSNPRSSETLLRAALFTDIVGSTEHLARIGDRAWRELFVAHEDRSRRAIERYGGRAVKSTGDGVLATFEGPAQAVRGAQEISASLADLGLQIRAGVHVGEIEAVGDDVTGVTVNAAARIAALAGPTELFVSSTVRDLTRGSGLTFEDAGEHELKGVADRWRLYRVVGEWSEQPSQRVPSSPVVIAHANFECRTSSSHRRRAICSASAKRELRLDEDDYGLGLTRAWSRRTS